MICRKRISMITYFVLLLLISSKISVANVTYTATIIGPDIILKDKATSYSANITPSGTPDIEWEKSTDQTVWTGFENGLLTPSATGKVYIRIKVNGVVQNPSKTIDVVDITLDSISGANLITGTQDKYVAVRANDGSVTVSLSINPTGFSLPTGTIQWPVGTAPQSGDQLQRIISKAAVAFDGINIKPTLNNSDIIDETLYIVNGPNDVVGYSYSYEQDNQLSTLGNFGLTSRTLGPATYSIGVSYDAGYWHLLVLAVNVSATWNVNSQSRVNIDSIIADYRNGNFPDGYNVIPPEAVQLARRSNAKEDFKYYQQYISPFGYLDLPHQLHYWANDFIVDHEEYHCSDWGYYTSIATVDNAIPTIQDETASAGLISPNDFLTSKGTFIITTFRTEFTLANTSYKGLNGKQHEVDAWDYVEPEYNELRQMILPD